MSVLSDLSISLKSYGKALRFIATHRLSKFFILPFILNMLLFFGGFALIGLAVDWLKEILFDQLDSWLGQLAWIATLKKIIYVFVWIAFKLLYFLLFVFFGGFIVLLFMSPALAYLSEKTEQLIKGTTFPFSVDQLVRDTFRGILVALRNMSIEFLYVILLFFIGFIPVINLAVPFILFAISSYFYGFSFMDYTNERSKRSVSESVSFLRKHKGAVTGNGLVFCLVLVVPYVGVFLAGFVAIVSVVAGTMTALELDDQSSSSSST
jgi:CysZ protein